ncbi:ATP-binding protein [Paenibacillus sp. NPDC058071]|uniref:ATP-binding protein n=1 Tax=Paenibacillus sp. NPDC058071 TaxID=3346326 RepID=UPI0036DE451C
MLLTIYEIVASIIQGLLYNLTASLLFVITPRFTYRRHRRKQLFVVLLALFSALYLVFGKPDPFVYALHLTPLSMTLAVLYEGLFPSVASWIVFSIAGLIVGNDPYTVLIPNTFVLLAGLVIHYRIKGGSHIRMMLLFLLLVASNLTVTVATMLAQGKTLDYVELTVVCAATLLSAVLVNYVFFQVKNQERVQQELILSERYQMIGQLTASISHEIRNPLTTTKGFLQLMGKKGVDLDTMERYRQHALEGIEHANTVISDYLNFSKPTSEEQRKLEVKEEINSVIPWLQPLSMLSNIAIQIHHLTKEKMFIYGETKKFQQIMLNVMKNAIESMPDGGTLTVQTQLNNGTVQIFIRDTGTGMSHSHVKRLGKPYFTTKSNGTGLGLMVVMSLVQSMNGKMMFRSKLNQGTICELHFEQASELKNL